MTEGDFDFHGRDYYKRLNVFLLLNNFDETIESLKELDPLWKDLEDWTFVNNGDLGFFVLQSLSNNWKYVGKPFSQCLLPPRVIKRLPAVFQQSDLIPLTKYTKSTFKSVLLTKASYLGLASTALKLVRENNNELGQSLIEIVIREFTKWSGESNDAVLIDSVERPRKNFTLAPLLLQFLIDESSGRLDFSYRFKSANEFPQDLKFNEFDNLYFRNGWSVTLPIPFSQSLELKDQRNKWTVKNPPKDIRLFIRGSYYEMDSDFWIETDNLVRTEWMYALVKNETFGLIEEWGKSFPSDCFVKKEYIGIPPGFSLYSFINPRTSCENVPSLELDATKTIKMVGGLRITFRQYLNQYRPEVQIENADGSEKVILSYKNETIQFELKRSFTSSDRWQLPAELNIDSDFYISIEGNENIRSLPYQLNSSSDSILTTSFPRRNKFQLLPIQNEPFYQGNSIHNIDLTNAYVDGMDFFSNNFELIDVDLPVLYESSLINWLIAKKTCTIAEFYNIFEYITSKEFTQQDGLLFLRRATLHLMDYLGYVDFEHTEDKITALPAKLILIPTSNGFRALLIGCRNIKLIEKILETVKKQKNVFVQLTFNDSKYLLPQTLILISEKENAFQQIAKSCELNYDKEYLLKLKQLIPTLEEYKLKIINNGDRESREGYGWPRKIFDRNTLKFVYSESIDKAFALVEYSFSSYRLEYGLWLDQKYYIVDKNWSRYLAIHFWADKASRYDKNKSVARPYLFYSNDNAFAIPASLPLPKLISRFFIQLSGKVPHFKQLTIEGKTRWFNVYYDVSHSLITNFFRFTLNIQIENTSTHL